jgi:hypothetical protein
MILAPMASKRVGVLKPGLPIASLPRQQVTMELL